MRMREQMTLTLTPIPMHRVSIKYCVVAGVPADARASSWHLFPSSAATDSKGLENYPVGYAGCGPSTCRLWYGRVRASLTHSHAPGGSRMRDSCQITQGLPAEKK